MILKNDMYEIFIPIKRALEHIIILPSDNYEKIKEEKELKEIEKAKEHMDNIFSDLFSKLKKEFIFEIEDDKNSAIVKKLGNKVLEYVKEEKII